MRQLANDLWVQDNSMRLMGTHAPLRTTVARLPDGGLWVHSPTELSEGLRAELDALGPVAAILAPNNAHHLWFKAWQEAYPSAAACVAKGIPGKVQDLAHYQFIEDCATDWAPALECKAMPNITMFDECVFFHTPSRSLIVTDLVQNWRGQRPTGVAWLMTKLIMEPIGFKDICLAPPLKFKRVVSDRTTLRSFLESILEWDFQRIIPTHGDIIEQDAKQTLADLAARVR